MLHFKSFTLNYLALFAATICFSVSCTHQSRPPADMVYFEGGDIIIGADNTLPNEAPAFKTSVEPFYLDVNPVTVAEFRSFVEETGYKTDAETFSSSAMLDYSTGEWLLVERANWQNPLGDGTPADDDHPVTHVSWNDASAFAEWAGRRLPYEVEWEYAAKNGDNSDQLYSWGNKLVKDGEYKANVWQGRFPVQNTADDGYLYTSPVGEFGETEAGLTDMGGNVWEWTSDTYTLYEGNPAPFQKHEDLKVIRGGSFLCHRDVCYSYRVSARQNNSRESSAFHLGFRTARDAR